MTTIGLLVAGETQVVNGDLGFGEFLAPAGTPINALLTYETGLYVPPPGGEGDDRGNVAVYPQSAPMVVRLGDWTLIADSYEARIHSSAEQDSMVFAAGRSTCLQQAGNFPLYVELRWPGRTFRNLDLERAPLTPPAQILIRATRPEGDVAGSGTQSGRRISLCPC